LIDGAIEQLAGQVRDRDYSLVENFERARGIGRFVAIPLVGLFAFLLIDPTSFGGAAYRLLSPGVHYSRPAPFQLLVQPGDTRVIMGDSLDISIRAVGDQIPESVQLEMRREGETRVSTVVLERGVSDEFVHVEETIRDAFSYRVVAGRVETDRYRVEVSERPFVRDFLLTLTPPAYTRLPSRTLPSNVGDLTAYAGTRVEVDLLPSSAIDSARILFESSTPVELLVSGDRVSGGFEVTRDDEYHFALVESSGLTNNRPIEYRVQRQYDQHPAITILKPNPTAELTDELAVDLEARISDDFGFTGLTLHYRLSESAFGEPQQEFSRVVLADPEPLVLDQIVGYRWPLDQLPEIDLVPGDVLEYYLEIADNDGYIGRKRTASAVHVLRFPSLAERFDQLDERQDEVSGELESLIEDAREVKDSFEQLRDELRRKQESDWTDQRQLDRLKEQQEQLEQRADELSNQVGAMVDQMEMQELVSPETLEQFEELKRVFDEINSPELDEALKRLQEAMMQLDLSEMQRSIGDVEFNEEQFLERLERALELFKRLRTEQKLEEAARRAEDLAQRQEQIRDKTKDLAERDDQVDGDEPPQESPEDSRDTTERPEGQSEEDPSGSEDDRLREQDDLAEEQDRSATDMESLEQLMEQIQEQMEEIRSAPQEEMEQLMQQVGQQNLDQQMQQNADEIRQGQLDQAQQGQQQMQQSLQQMAQQLQQMQEQMSGDQMRQNMAGLRRALDDVLTLSLEQEQLRDGVREVASREAGLRRFTQQQSELHEGLSTVSDSLVEMARSIPQMSREIQVHAGQASLDMDRAVEEMVERRGPQAVAYQKSAMTNLNELALLLSDLMQNLQNQQSGVGGMSMQQMIEQLQQMAGDQQQLNEQIQQMLNEMQGARLSPDAQQRLEQMARQQEALRRQLEEMGQDAPSAADQLLGDLEQIARQMEESIEEMQQRSVDSRTVRRQQEILTRLLNAQRSIRERGKERRREGRTGEDVARESPSELTPDERADQLRRELLDALESGYSADYEELIRRYFEVLQEIE
jgi:hypothetical protein